MAAWQRNLHAASCWDFPGGSLISCSPVHYLLPRNTWTPSLRLITFIQTAWLLTPCDAVYVSIRYDLFSREYRAFGLKTFLSNVFSVLLKFEKEAIFCKVQCSGSQRVHCHISLPALSAHSNGAFSYIPKMGGPGEGCVYGPTGCRFKQEEQPLPSTFLFKDEKFSI